MFSYAQTVRATTAHAMNTNSAPVILISKPKMSDDRNKNATCAPTHSAANVSAGFNLSSMTPPSYAGRRYAHAREGASGKKAKGLAWVKGLGQGAFYWPASTQASLERRLTETQDLSPFPYASGDAIECQEAAREGSQSALNRPTVIQTLMDGRLAQAGKLGPFLDALGLSVERQVGMAGAVEWGRKRLPSWPAMPVDSEPESLLRKVTAASPLRERERLSVEGEAHVVPFVVGLFELRGPGAVFLRIRAVVIASFDLMFGRGTWSHVGVERREVISPAITDGDPTSAVVGVMSGLWIQTSGNHVVPHVVFRDTTQTVSTIARGSDFRRVTPAANTGAANQTIDQDTLLSPARTAARPSLSIYPRKNSPASECAPGQITRSNATHVLNHSESQAVAGPSGGH